MINRSTLYSSPGGDTIQMEQTAKFLSELGVSVDIIPSSEHINYENYDLLHLFNIIRPNDFISIVSKTNLPVAISTIYVDYTEHQKEAQKGLLGFLSKFIDGDKIEYIKVIARHFINNEKISSPKYIWLGHRKSIRYLLNRSSILLPNSNSENNRLLAKFGVLKQSKIIPNGIDLEKFDIKLKCNAKYANSIICVGRIESRKNQLNLIRAVNRTNYKLIIIGKKSPNQKKYYEKCRKEAHLNNNIVFEDHMAQEHIIEIMKSARVHALASWFETTGLVSLEAAYMGCNIVITNKGDQKEYFEDLAFYCDPSDVSSIKTAIDEAYSKPFREKLREKIKKNYNWNVAAEKTLDAYKTILNNA